jgi:hypothetical protein
MMAIMPPKMHIPRQAPQSSPPLERNRRPFIIASSAARLVPGVLHQLLALRPRYSPGHVPKTNDRPRGATSTRLGMRVANACVKAPRPDAIYCSFCSLRKGRLFFAPLLGAKGFRPYHRISRRRRPNPTKATPRSGRIKKNNRSGKFHAYFVVCRAAQSRSREVK